MKKLIIIVFATVVFATGIKWYHNATIDKGTLDDGPSCSIYDSKARGLFKSNANIEPKSISVGDNVIDFNESWFESRKKTTFEYVWFEKARPVDGIKFCFTLKNDDKHLKTDGKRIYFVIEDMGKGVGINYKPECIVFSYTFNETENENFRMSLIDNWQENRQKNIYVKSINTEL